MFTLARVDVTRERAGALTRRALAAALPVQRAGDPLGLGRARPCAPADPDAYSREREDTEGARSLLSAEERLALDADIKREGVLGIAAVRRIIAENCPRDQLETSGLDADMLLLIDARIDYKLFIAGDTIYSREELYASFPFHEFGIQPEAVFAAQLVGVFVAAPSGHAHEYAVRDENDARLEFSPAEDIVRQARTGTPPRQPTKIVHTKIYVGREPWADFLLQMRFYRGAVRNAAVSVGLALPAPDGRAEVADGRVEVADGRAEVVALRAEVAALRAEVAALSAALYKA